MEALERGAQLDRPVGGGFDHIAQNLVGPLDIAAPTKSAGELAAELVSERTLGQEGCRAAEQVDGRRGVAALPCADARSAEPVAGFARDDEVVLADGPELDSEEPGLFEVVPDELVEVRHAASEPGGEAPVKVRAAGLRRRPVRGFADQNMPERESLLVQQRPAERADQILLEPAREGAVRPRSTLPVAAPGRWGRRTRGRRRPRHP